MQRRVLAAAVALMCVNAVTVRAQLMPLQDDPAQSSSVRITPFVGYLPSITRHETWIHNDGTQNTFVPVDYKLASGNAAGLTAEMSVHGPWNAFAGAMFGSRGNSEFDLTQSGQQYAINGSRYLVARLGASYTLREKESDLTFRRMSASAFAAPFYMREMPRRQLGFADANVFNGSNHFGVSLGAAGEMPFARDRMALQVAIEDNATWWSSDALSRLPDAFFNDPAPASSTRVDTDVSHLWMIRAGLSWRLR